MSRLSRALVGALSGAWDSIVFILKEALVRGSSAYYAVLLALLVAAAYGVSLWVSVHHAPVLLGADYGGMIVTGLSDEVPWGVYIAFFTFWMGMAASASMFLLAAYAFRDPEFEKAVPVALCQALAAVVVSVSLILMDLGRPIRGLMEMMLLPNLRSPLDWDVLVYTLIALVSIVGILAYVYYYRRGRGLPRGLALALTVIGVPVLLGGHTVSAFITQGLAARPLWHSALTAPKHIITALASGPAMTLLLLMIAEKYVKGFKVKFDVYRKTLYVIAFSLAAGLYCTASEVQEVLWYTSEHLKRVQMLQLLSSSELPYLPLLTWLWVGLAVSAIVLTLIPEVRRKRAGVALVCVHAIAAVLCEKTVAHVVAGLAPGPFGEVVPYWPTPIEWAVTLGGHALGLLVLALVLRPVLVAMTLRFSS